MMNVRIIEKIRRVVRRMSCFCDHISEGGYMRITMSTGENVEWL